MKAHYLKTIEVQGTIKPTLLTPEDYEWASKYEWSCHEPGRGPARTVQLDGKQLIVYLHDEILWRAVLFRGTPCKRMVKATSAKRPSSRTRGPATIIEFPRLKPNKEAK